MKSKRSAKQKPHPRPQLLLALDPAGAAGIALFAEGKLVAHAPCNGSSWLTFMQTLKPLVEPYLLKYPPEERHVVLERHQRVHTTLGERRGIAQAAAEACGFPTWTYVHAATWQSVIFNHKRPDDTKVAATDYVEAHYGFRPEIDDVADAICLGSYYISQCVLTF